MRVYYDQKSKDEYEQEKATFMSLWYYFKEDEEWFDKQVVDKYLEENVKEYKSVSASGFARASKDSDDWIEKRYNGKYIVLESSLENESGETHKGFRLLDIKHYFENGNGKSEKGFVMDFKEV